MAERDFLALAESEAKSSASKAEDNVKLITMRFA
jgi:hypothetical protein